MIPRIYELLGKDRLDLIQKKKNQLAELKRTAPKAVIDDEYIDNYIRDIDFDPFSEIKDVVRKDIKDFLVNKFGFLDPKIYPVSSKQALLSKLIQKLSDLSTFSAGMIGDLAFATAYKNVLEFPFDILEKMSLICLQKCF